MCTGSKIRHPDFPSKMELIRTSWVSHIRERDLGWKTKCGCFYLFISLCGT
jgi:hypothetical protein